MTSQTSQTSQLSHRVPRKNDIFPTIGKTETTGAVMIWRYRRFEIDLCKHFNDRTFTKKVIEKM